MSRYRALHRLPIVATATFTLISLLLLAEPSTRTLADEGEDDVRTTIKQELAKMREQLRLEIRADLQKLLDERDQRLQRQINNLLNRRRSGGGGGGGGNNNDETIYRIVIRSNGKGLQEDGKPKENLTFELELKGEPTPKIRKALDEFHDAVEQGEDPEQALQRLRGVLKQAHKPQPADEESDLHRRQAEEGPPHNQPKQQAPHDKPSDKPAHSDREQPFLGVNLIGIDTLLDKPQKAPESGVVVVSVVKGSPAEHAGIQPRDVITGVAGKPITTFAAFADLIAKQHPGDQITISLQREGWQKIITVTLGSRSKR